MTQGKTRLADQCHYLVRRPTEIFLKPDETSPETSSQEDLSREELLKQPVHIPHRPLKDPREIGLLDPACGSMHFGLYAFDLFEAIYEESWDFGLEVLRRDYPEKDAFLREMPRLIIEHNLHGIDIDPRAVQIAGLSLWLRAQKSWQAQRVPAAERPRIMRSNIVCAEPMPGSTELLKDFAATLHPPLLGQMVERVFAQMQLAGEAGSLLKVEEEIATLVKEAKKLWQTRPKAEQMELSLGLEKKQKQGELPLDISGISDERFWDTAEELIYAALRAYAEQAESGGYQRRLFSEDAARGFAFIDLCRKKYDVVVMNPPFGDITPQCRALLESFYWNEKHDMAVAFVTRGVSLLCRKGVCGAITTRTPLFVSSSTNWRLNTLSGNNKINTMADLGHGVLDTAMVETAAYTVENECDTNNSSSVFRLLTLEDKGKRLVECVSSVQNGISEQDFYLVNQKSLECIENFPFSYWVPRFILKIFSRESGFESDGCIVRQGGGTTDDFRFTRLRWEITAKNLVDRNFVLISQGEDATPFAADISLLVRWKDDGIELKTYLAEYRRSKGWSPHWAAILNGYEYYFKPGLRFWRRSNRFTVSTLPSGVIFTKAHQAIFTDNGQELDVLGLLNTSIFNYLTVLQRGGAEGGLQFEVGLIKRTPTPSNIPQVKQFSRQCWDRATELMLRDETHSLFWPADVASVGTKSICDLLLFRSRAVGSAINTIRVCSIRFK